jgi:hypothetical protein
MPKPHAKSVRIEIPLDIQVQSVSGRGRSTLSATVVWDNGHWTLRIDGTRGHWTLRTLLFGYPEEEEVLPVSGTMAIDAGAGWYIENWPEVLGSALKVVLEDM